MEMYHDTVMDISKMVIEKENELSAIKSAIAFITEKMKEIGSNEELIAQYAKQRQILIDVSNKLVKKIDELRDYVSQFVFEGNYTPTPYDLEFDNLDSNLESSNVEEDDTSVDILDEKQVLSENHLDYNCEPQTTEDNLNEVKNQTIDETKEEHFKEKVDNQNYEPNEIKINEVKVYYSSNSNQYTINIDLEINGEKTSIPLSYKLKKELLYNSEIMIDTLKASSNNPEFYDNIDINKIKAKDSNIFFRLLLLDKKLGTTLAEDYYNEKLNINKVYNLENIMFSRHLNIIDKFVLYRLIVNQSEDNTKIFKPKLFIAAEQKFESIKDWLNKYVKPHCDKSVKYVKFYWNKLKRNPEHYLRKFKNGLYSSAIIGGIITIGVTGINASSKIIRNNTNINNENTSDNGIDGLSKSLSKTNSMSNAVTSNENKETTEDLQEIDNLLKYYEENYYYDTEELITKKMNSMAIPNRGKAAKIVALEIRMEVKKLEEKKQKEEYIAGKEDSTQADIIANADEKSVSTGQSSENQNLSSISNSATETKKQDRDDLEFKIGEKINLNGKVLTGDSQGNGPKCYPDNFKCDYFEISTIVVWNGSQVVDIIRQDKGQNDITVNDLYKKYGADIDIVFNFNGCFADKSNKYENMGWINIDEICSFTDEQKQAIAESKDDTKSEYNDINEDDSASINELYNDLEKELSNNKKLSSYTLKLTL